MIFKPAVWGRFPISQMKKPTLDTLARENYTLSITRCNAHTVYECSFIGAFFFFFIDLIWFSAFAAAAATAWILLQDIFYVHRRTPTVVNVYFYSLSYQLMHFIYDLFRLIRFHVKSLYVRSYRSIYVWQWLVKIGH